MMRPVSDADTSFFAPPISDFLFSGGALISSCTAHFWRSAFQAVLISFPAPLISRVLLFRRCSYLFLHRPLLIFCFQAVRTLLLAPLTSGILLFRRCSYLFLHRPFLTFCFQAVLISLLHRSLLAFCFSGGALISPCTAHFRRSAF